MQPDDLFEHIGKFGTMLGQALREAVLRQQGMGQMIDITSEPNSLRLPTMPPTLVPP